MNFFASEKPLHGIVTGHPLSIPYLQNNTPYIIIMKIHFMHDESRSLYPHLLNDILVKRKTLDKSQTGQQTDILKILFGI